MCTRASQQTHEQTHTYTYAEGCNQHEILVLLRYKRYKLNVFPNTKLKHCSQHENT